MILGAGGFGNVVLEVARTCGQYHTVSFLDDAASAAIGTCAQYQHPDMQKNYRAAYPAFGKNTLRAEWVQRLLQAGYTVPVLVHPRAYVSPSAKLAPGTIVLPGAVVNTGCELGYGCIVNIGALIDHNCVLEEGVHIAPGAVVKANNLIDSYEKIESGTVIERREAGNPKSNTKKGFGNRR